MKFVFTICSVFFVAFALANTPDSLRSEQRAEGLIVIHQVEEQETLYSIARRYKGSVAGIIKRNGIEDNTIDIGQVIEILVEKKEEELFATEQTIPNNVHKVVQGETLYGIAQKYNVRLKELRKWNELEGNAISLGMLLKLGKNVKVTTADLKVESDTISIFEPIDTIAIKVEEVDPFKDFEKYLVQTGETLYTIATKIGVQMDSLRGWNSLDSDFLKIGQQLYYKQESDSLNSSFVKKNGTRTQIDDDGFERVFEEGVASVIESMETSRFLALHRTLPIGTNLEVRNLMNNQVVHVKVVGRLPNTGLNKNLLIRVSQAAYDQLRILDPKSRVEVSYFKQ